MLGGWVLHVREITENDPPVLTCWCHCWSSFVGC